MWVPKPLVSEGLSLRVADGNLGIELVQSVERIQQNFGHKSKNRLASRPLKQSDGEIFQLKTPKFVEIKD